MAGMGVGALTALATGKDPFMGAAVGGASGGMFGGADGFGSGFGFDTMGFDVGTNLIGDTAATGLTNAGTSLGQGGMQTAAGQGLLGATPSFASVGAPQIGSVVTPENTPNLLMDSAYNAPVTPTDTYTGNLSMMTADNLGSTQTIGVDNPDLYTGGGYDPAMGAEQLNYRPDFTPIAGTNEGGGGYEYDFLDTFKISDYTPSNEFMNQTAMGMGINALTPEQRQQMQVQQARLARGQMPDLELEQGYGSQFISRA
jgi:hypothetical protein